MIVGSTATKYTSLRASLLTNEAPVTYQVLVQICELAVVFIRGLVKQLNMRTILGSVKNASPSVSSGWLLNLAFAEQENQRFGCRVEVYWIHTEEDHAE